MSKIAMMSVVMAFIAFGFTNGALAAGKDESAGADRSMSSNSKNYNTQNKDVHAWIGKHVKNSQGDDLGKVKDLVRDDSGKISLAVISHGGMVGIGKKDVAVPFSALSFNKDKDYFVLNATKDELASAPEVRGQNLHDRTFAENVYRHFGVRPHWTDQGMKSDQDSGSRGYFGSDRDSGVTTNPDAYNYFY